MNLHGDFVSIESIMMLQYASRICYSNIDTLNFSYDMSVKYKDSPGCFCECGVAAGAQIIAMRAGAPNKVIHAFDSFCGIPMPSNKDDQMPGIKYFTEEERLLLPDPGKQKLETTGMTSVSIEDFKKHMIDSGAGLDNLVTHPGWFEDTTAGYPKGHEMEISILRLDGDLYNSTWVCLENFYPLVLSGGIVIIDDWELPGSRSAVEEFFMMMEQEYDIEKPEIKFVSNIAYFYKP